MFAALYEYSGDIIVLTSPICEFAGETEPANFCFYCKKLLRRVVIHLKQVHQDEARVKEINNLASLPEKALAFEQLLREGNFFVNNSIAMATQKGFVIPTRKSPHFRCHTTLVHCTKCYMLMERYNYNRHVDRCAMRNTIVEGDAPTPSLWEEKNNQFGV